MIVTKSMFLISLNPPRPQRFAAAPPDVDALVRRAKAHDREAVASLYDLHANAIYRYIFYRVPNAADAEDLTAEVFVKMVEGLPRYTFTGAPFEAWLYRIAAARVVDYRRRLRRRPQTELSETIAAADALPEDDLLRDHEVATLRRALRQFSDEEQTLLILRFVERKSHQEVAEVLGKSTTAVKSMQHRTLTKLATLLGTDSKSRHYLRGQRS